jgi:hypothetical protein
VAEVGFEGKNRQQSKLHVPTDDGSRARFRNTGICYPKFLLHDVQNMCHLFTVLILDVFVWLAN